MSEFDLDFTDDRDLEKYVGIETYNTTTEGIGGLIKMNPSDFIVSEITLEGEILSINPTESKFKSDIDEKKKSRFTTFTLVKQNEDTIIASQIIAGALKVPYDHMSWAGLKDNNAITAQKMCVRGDYAEKLAELQFNNLMIKDISYSRKAIKVGELYGNLFDIKLRNLGCDNKGDKLPSYDTLTPEKVQNLINETAQQINKSGFPNFFGLQRFGSHRPNSHTLGKLIFQKKYQEVIENFLMKSYPKEYDSVKEARNQLKESKNFQEALENFPRGLRYERKMIEYLCHKPDKLKGALLTLPLPLLKILMSAYQSYLFNKAISKRKKMGQDLSKPVKGDLITILSEENGIATPLIYHYGRSYDDAIEKAFKLKRATVLCPLVGYLTNYPESYFEKIYEDLFELESFSQSDFQNENFPQVQFKGAMRATAVIPKALDVKYIPKKNQRKRHVNLSFSLPKGTYATMLIREFTKS